MITAEPIDVDALERCFKVCDPNYNYHKVEKVVQEMLTALRQQQAKAEGFEKSAKSKQRVIARLTIELKELKARLKALEGIGRETGNEGEPNDNG